MPADVSAFLQERSFEDLSRELDTARTTHWEDPEGSLEVALRCQAAAGGLGYHELCGRALTLRGAVSLNRGDLQGAVALAAEAARHVAGYAEARCELASLKSQLSFFSGAYNEAMQQAEEAIAIADALREAGRIEDAYDALSRSAELEREGMRQLAELRLSVERATVETRAARHENVRLAALVDELAAARATLEQRTAELEGLKEQFREQADRDWLTGLHNRRYLARQLDGAQAFSLAVLDLDNFKSVNDDHGHEAGDQVLVRVADLLLSVVRHSDVVARTGGEEFVLLMPRTELAAAVRCCERALEAIRSAPWAEIAAGLRVTASIGIAGADEGTEFDSIAALADTRLYAAKRAGRDRVVWA